MRWHDTSDLDHDLLVPPQRKRRGAPRPAPAVHIDAHPGRRAEAAQPMLACSRWPQTANTSPSSRPRPGRYRMTPVGSVVRTGYEQRPPRTAAPTRRRGRAMPRPGGTITTRPRANTSRWASAQPPADAVQRRRPIGCPRSARAPVGRSKRAPRPIGVATGAGPAAGCAAPSRAATSSRTATARAVISGWVRAGAHVACHVSQVGAGGSPARLGCQELPARARSSETECGLKRGCASAVGAIGRRGPRPPRDPGRGRGRPARRGCRPQPRWRPRASRWPHRGGARTRSWSAAARRARRACSASGAGGPPCAATPHRIRHVWAAAWQTRSVATSATAPGRPPGSSRAASRSPRRTRPARAWRDTADGQERSHPERCDRRSGQRHEQRPPGSEGARALVGGDRRDCGEAAHGQTPGKPDQAHRVRVCHFIPGSEARLRRIPTPIIAIAASASTAESRGQLERPRTTIPIRPAGPTCSATPS